MIRNLFRKIVGLVRGKITLAIAVLALLLSIYNAINIRDKWAETVKSLNYFYETTSVFGEFIHEQSTHNQQIGQLLDEFGKQFQQR